MLAVDIFLQAKSYICFDFATFAVTIFFNDGGHQFKAYFGRTRYGYFQRTLRPELRLAKEKHPTMIGQKALKNIRRMFQLWEAKGEEYFQRHHLYDLLKEHFSRSIASYVR